MPRDLVLHEGLLASCVDSNQSLPLALVYHDIALFIATSRPIRTALGLDGVIRTTKQCTPDDTLHIYVAAIKTCASPGQGVAWHENKT